MDSFRQRAVSLLFRNKLPDRIAFLCFCCGNNATGAGFSSSLGRDVRLYTLHDELVQDEIGKDEPVKSVCSGSIEADVPLAGSIVYKKLP